MIRAGENILLTLWVGGSWFSGYVVAPLLFQMLDKKTAGMVAGQVFTVTSYIGIVCVGFLLLSLLVDASASRLKNFRVWMLAVILLFIIIGQFVLSPMMVELKQAGLSNSIEVAGKFATLHGISSSLFLVNSILGLMLVIFGLRQIRPISSEG
ncbi:MAG: DUF4149 domain-containing protein [Gammaproteobacteria bacterium]|nr:DUF4149 domain-containing protein [Gammaproteobacteria bacterium]